MEKLCTDFLIRMYKNNFTLIIYSTPDHLSIFLYIFSLFPDKLWSGTSFLVQSGFNYWSQILIKNPDFPLNFLRTVYWWKILVTM